MNGGFNDLDRRMVADIDSDVGREGNLREAKRSRVRVVRWTDDLERRKHRVAHVRWDGSQSQVDVEEGRFVALEPAWLDRYRSAANGPFGSIRRGGHASAWSLLSAID